MVIWLRMLPPVTIIWLNYNSMHLIDVTKKSLDTLMRLDYPDFEAIIVDNNSSDGSREIIEQCLKEYKGNLNIKFLRLKRNWGSTGANNIAYSHRNIRSKYLALTHNDVIPELDYLKKTVSFLESHKEVGAIQGVVVKLGSQSIVDSSGFMMNESLFVSSPYNAGPVVNICKPMYVSIVEGTMPVYNLDAVKNALKSSTDLFITAGFMYYLEDSFLSLELWANGFKCVLLPIIVGSHFRMGTSKKTAKKRELFYYLLRNRIALLTMTNSAGKLGFIMQNLRKLVISNRSSTERQAILVSLIDGVRLGRGLRKKYGLINFYSAPFIRDSMKARLNRWMH
jgi:GT2 family glycosyltransferase